MTEGRNTYHHGDLRAAVLEAARDQLRVAAVSELSMREIARKLGVSPGAPYRHFPDKQALVVALAEDGWRQLNEDYSMSDPRTGPFRDRLVARATAFVRLAAAEPHLLDVMLRHQEAGAISASPIDPGFAAAVDRFAEAGGNGELAGDPVEVTITVLAMLEGLGRLVGNGIVAATDVDQTVAAAISVLYTGLEPREPNTPRRRRPAK